MIILFDLDGTLVESGKNITNKMYNMLLSIKNYYKVKFGIVGGGVYDKIISQLDLSLYLFDYIFSECGSVVYKRINNQFTLIKKNNIYEKMDLSLYNKIETCFYDYINENEFVKDLYVSQYNEKNLINKYKLIDIRNALLYLSPVGLVSSDEYRNKFIKYNIENKFRDKLICKLKDIDNLKNFDIVLGGSIGIAIYPKEWNKAQIIPYIHSEKLYNIYFFGDKVLPDGNDYPLYIHRNVKGFGIIDPNDAFNKLKEQFF